MSMGFKMFVFIICVDLMVALTQASLDNINPNAPKYVGAMPTDRYASAAQSNVSIYDAMPDSVTASPPSSGVAAAAATTWFTDALNSVKSWYREKLLSIPVIGPGLQFFEDVVRAPWTLCQLVGLPLFATISIAGLWWAMTAMSVTLMLVGRD